MTGIILELIKLAGVGLIAGFFSSMVANSDFRQRKWWELRVEAYQDVIEALSDVVYYYDRHYTHAIERREMSDELQKKLSSFWDSAYPRIRKAADSGAFLFSDEVNAVLHEFMKEEIYYTWEDDLDTNLAKATKCLQVLVERSKTDLKLKSHWLKELF